MKKTNFIIFIVLAVLVMIFFHELVFFKRCLVCNDMIAYYYQNMFFVDKCFKNKEFPLWNPLIFFGFPTYAAGQAGVLYPFNIMFSFIPPHLKVNYSIVLHIFLSGICMFFFISLFVKNKIIALFGAVTWMFSGLFTYRIEHLSIILSICYIPLLFFLTEKYIQNKNKIYPIIFAPVITIVIFLGHPQILFYILISLFIYYLLRTAILKIQLFSCENFVLLIFIIIGFFMAAVQVLPTIELTSLSERSAGLQQKTILNSESIHLLNLFNTIYPYIFGSFHNNTFIGNQITGAWTTSYLAIYTGIFTFIMLILGFKMAKKLKISVVFWGIIIFAFLFSLGKNFFLNTIISGIPGLNFFKNPIQMMQLYVFFAAVFACYILDNLEKEDIPLKTFKVLLVLILFFLITTLILKFTQNVILNHFSDKIEGLIKSKIMNTAYHHYSYEYYINKFLKTKSFIIDHILIQNIFLFLFILLIICFGNGKIEKPKFIYCILFLTILELFINLKPYQKTINEKFLISGPETVSFIKNTDKGFYRILPWRFFENDSLVFKNGRMNGTYEEFMQSKEILQPITNIIPGILSFWGYDPLGYKKYYNFYKGLEKGALTGGHNSINELKKSFNTLIISGVKYIFSPFPLKLAALKEIKKIKNIYIYQNLKHNELVKFFTDVIYVENDKEALDLIFNGSIDFQTQVIINDNNKIKYKKSMENPKINLIKWGNGKIEFTIKNENDGVVVISNYFNNKKQNKDWVVLIDGKKSDILNANYIFMALRINKGNHKVTINYKPYFFRIGIYISIFSILIYFIISFFVFRKNTTGIIGTIQ